MLNKKRKKVPLKINITYYLYKVNEKIKKAESEEAKEKAQQERATVKRNTRTSSRSNSTEKAIIKVLTSATVIRGVLGILGKLIK